MKTIFQCAQTNDVIGLNSLIADGADVNSKDQFTGETLLHYSVVGQAYEATVALVQAGADVNVRTYHFGETPLHTAVQQGNVKMINLFIDAGADPNAKNNDGEGPIFTAIRWDHPHVISTLAKRGSRINAINSASLTPLQVAYNFQSPGLVKALIECGAVREVSGVPEVDLEIITTQNIPRTNTVELLTKPMTANNATRNKKNVRKTNTPETANLFDLVANNQSDKLKESISASTFNDDDIRAEYSGETLLHTAVIFGASECVDVLIKFGSKVNTFSEPSHETPLHVSIQEGFFDIFHSLLRAGADIEAETIEGETPIFYAVKNNRSEMFRALVRRGAKINKLNFDKLAPLHFAVMDSNLYLLESLLYYGADPTIGGSNPYLFSFRANTAEDLELATTLQKTAPVLAHSTLLPHGIFSIIRENNVEALEKMIFKGFEVNLIDILEGAPIHCAVTNSAFECLELLIKNGADINISSIQKKETPLQIAIKKNDEKLIEYLLKNGATVDNRNDEGENAVFYAVRQKNPPLTVKILNIGADVNEMNDNGQTPLYVAVSLRANETADALLENGADPSLEVHPSLKLATEMGQKDLAEKLEKIGAKVNGTRFARATARKTRRECQSSLGSRPTSPEKTERKNNLDSTTNSMLESSLSNTAGRDSCCICTRHKATQKLIPCGCLVACNGCIKDLIEMHVPCPKCGLKFYATAKVN